MTFEQYVVEQTGKNVYQIKLEIAMALYIGGQEDTGWCFLQAQKFIEEMKVGYETTLDRSESE